MEAVNIGALFSFVVITTFSPGPNNISSSSMGILYGYRKSLPYLLGIASGFLLMMVLCGIVSRTLYAIFPSLEGVMRIIGAAYILWLAYKTLKSSYQFSVEDSPALGFNNGFLLQALNPKLWVYGLTLYTTFLAAITDNGLLMLVSAAFLTLVALSAVSTWTISGAAISRFLHDPKFQKVINTFLALLLAITALDLSGLF